MVRQSIFVPVFNRASHHEDVLRNGGIAPHILNLGTRWRWVVSFMLSSLYLRGKSRRLLLKRRLGGPQRPSGRGRESNPGRTAHNLVTVLTELPLHLGKFWVYLNLGDELCIPLFSILYAQPITYSTLYNLCSWKTSLKYDKPQCSDKLNLQYKLRFISDDNANHLF
jgi:hypothetical protein